MRILKIPNKSPSKDQPLKAAAYARVSVNTAETERSLVAQMEYYEKYIKSHSNWDYAGIFSDFGFSGAKEDRPGFIALMNAARAGEVDFIITKSVTRFARNILTLLASLRELKELGVDVFFEEENLHSLSSEGELLITLLAIRAEEEVRNYSDLAKLSVKRRFEKGNFTHGLIYGYQNVDGQYEIIPQEAEIVRRIFDEYLKGKGPMAIASMLNSEGLTKTRYSKKYLEHLYNPNDETNPDATGDKKPTSSPVRLWRKSMIEAILKNEKYMGDALLQKTFISDYRTKKKHLNKGELDQYYVSEAHPAIISRETFEKVQAERKRRREQRLGLSSQKESYCIPRLFAGLVFCSNCGSSYTSRVHIKNGCYRISYNCHRSKNHHIHCHNPRIRESVIVAHAEQVLKAHYVSHFTNGIELTRELVEHFFTRIEVSSDQLIFHLKNGKKVVTYWQLTRPDTWGDQWKPLPDHPNDTTDSSSGDNTLTLRSLERRD